MQASKVSINQIFDFGSTLFIPFFQRSYVWDTEEWKRFLSDMQQLTVNNEEFFLGTIILKKETDDDTKERTVVDGQQRLTTLIILLKVLSLQDTEDKGLFNFVFKNPVNKKPKLRHSYIDKIAFDKILALDTLCDIQDGDSNQIMGAYSYFQHHAHLYNLKFSTILEKVSLVAIELAPNENEQQIFETLNSLGRRLTTGELLKNHIFDNSMIDEYQSIWVPVFEKDEECIKYWASTITAGRTSRSNTEGFFHAFLQIQMHNKKYKVSSEHKLIFRKADSVFPNYKTFIAEYVKDDIIEFVRELCSYASIYREAFEADIRLESTPSYPCIERMNFIVYALDATTLIPYVLFVVKNVSDEDERNKIFDFLESYIVRRAICKASNDNYSDLFNEHLIANEIITHNGLKSYIDSKGTTSILMPNDDMVYESFHSVALNNNRAKSILFLLESKIRGEDFATALLPCNSYSLEHLMPKKWKKNWPLPSSTTEEQRDLAVNSLGNMMLLPISLNASISNSDWYTKKNGSGKKKGLVHYASDLAIWNGALSKSIWDEDAISERAEWLAEKANEMWFNECSDDVKPIKGQKQDTSSYSLDGHTFMNHARFVPHFIKLYVEKHSDLTFEQLKDIFPDNLMPSKWRRLGLLATTDTIEASQKSERERRKWYYYPDEEYKLKSVEGITFYVNNQWSSETIQAILKIAETDGWEITKK